MIDFKTVYPDGFLSLYDIICSSVKWERTKDDNGAKHDAVKEMREVITNLVGFQKTDEETWRYSFLNSIGIAPPKMSEETTTLFCRISLEPLQHTFGISFQTQNETSISKGLFNEVASCKDTTHRADARSRSPEHWCKKNGKAIPATIRRYWFYFFFLLADFFVDENNSIQRVTLNKYGKKVALCLIEHMRLFRSNTQEYYFLLSLINQLNKEMSSKEVRFTQFFYIGLLYSAMVAEQVDISKLAKENAPDELSVYLQSAKDSFGKLERDVYNIDAKVSELYIPALFDKADTTSDMEPNEATQYEICDFFPTTRRLFIIGKPGYGKRTFLQALLLFLCGENITGFGPYQSEITYIPILLDCKAIKIYFASQISDYVEAGIKELDGSGTILKLVNEPIESMGIVLLLNGIEQLRDPNTGASNAKTTSLFLSQLDDYLSTHKNSSCIITSASKYPLKESGLCSEFYPIYMHRLTKKQIEDYCVAWYKHLYEGQEISEEYIITKANDISESITDLRSLKRILHRRLYLSYYLGDSFLQPYKRRPRSAVALIQGFVENSISDSLTVNKSSDLFSEYELNTLLSIIASRMLGKENDYISGSELTQCLIDSKEMVGSYLNDKLLTISDGNYISVVSAILTRLWFINTEDFSDKGKWRLSFSSTPILLFFGACAVARGIDANNKVWDKDPTYPTNFILNNIDDWSIKKPAPIDWDEYIVWICYLLDRQAENVISELLLLTNDLSASNRERQILCVCALAGILTTRPLVDLTFIHKIYHAAFGHYLYKEQLDYFHDLVNSSLTHHFTDTVLSDFLREETKISPPFVWVIGYIDYQDLFRKKHSLYSDHSKSLRKNSKLYEEGCDNPSLELFLDYFEKLCSAENANNIEVVRYTLVVATFYWLSFFNADSNTSISQDLDSGFFYRSKGCLLRLLAHSESTSANIACYALAHAVNRGIIREAEIQSRLTDVILADYWVRKAYPASRKPSALCGPLRLITSLPLACINKTVKICKKEIIDFYRAQWEDLIRINEDRQAVLLCKICLMIDTLWSCSEKNDNIRVLKNRKVKMLPYDGNQTILNFDGKF